MKTGSYRTLLLVAAAASLACSGGRAQAQTSCDAPYEAIITLKAPELGIPTVWDARYKPQDVMAQLVSGVAKEGGTVLALGRTLAREDYKPQDIVLAEINRRGRILNETKIPANAGETPVKVVPISNGYAVLSNLSYNEKSGRRRAKISWFSEKGKLRNEAIIKDDNYHYEGVDLVEAADGKGFIVVLHAVHFRQDTDQYGVLIHLAADGRQLWKRAYRPGIPNRIAGVERVGRDSYAAVGRIRMDDGRMAGWAMNLGLDGTVLWQRTYPRGAYANLRRAVFSDVLTPDEHGFYLAGETAPFDGGPDAAWLLAITGLGDPIWQRYFRRPDFGFSAFGLLYEKDGRVSLALNAKPLEGSGHRGHVRMIVASPQGSILQDEAYIDGIQAVGFDMQAGWNQERIVSATIESDDKPIEADLMKPDGSVPVVAPEGDKKSQSEQEGWIFVATALDPRNDPCAPKTPSPAE